MKKKLVCAVLLSIATALPAVAVAKSVSVDEDTLKALQEMIQKQQSQLDSQSEAIAQMQKKIAEQDVQIDELPEIVSKHAARGGFLLPGNDKVKVKLEGQVNRAVMFSDDGNQDDVFFVDNDTSSSRIALKGRVKVDDEWSAGSDFEVEYQSNDSNVVSMDTQNVDSGFKRRKLDFFLQSKTFGKLSIGHGASPTDATSEADLSGTNVVGYSYVASNGGGLKFYDNTAVGYSSVKVSKAYNNLDGLSRLDRVRYDTPAFNGFTLSTSFGEENAHDAAVRYKNKFEQFTLVARAGWAYMKADNSGQDKDQLSGSTSILFNNGFNVTLAAGSKDRLDEATNNDDATFYYGKIGQQFNIWSIGSTNISLDYGKYKDQVASNDDGDVYGVQFVQNLNKFSTELYAGYRLFSLDSDGTDYEDISSVISGFRFKF